MAQRVLIAGFSTRHVVHSAHMAGFIPYAIDHFCDQDLHWFTKDRMKFEEITDLPDCIQTMCKKYPIDFLIATSGAEQVGPTIPLIGTPPQKVERFLDKLETYFFFTENQIPTPLLTGDDEFPAMLKPRRGAGGWRNQIVQSKEEREEWIKKFPGLPAITQNVVRGIPTSVSCLSDGKRAITVAMNEQLLQNTPTAPFGFAGSITPIIHPHTNEMERYAAIAATSSGCIGSFGIDFVLGDRAWAIEVNPRFQATIDTVEMATSWNIFKLHIDAYYGRLPKKSPRINQFAVRKILFADKSMTISSNIGRLYPWVADIPWPGVHLEEGNPIVSVYGLGKSRSEACEMLNKNITSVYRYINQ